ncbi:coproporphyrinogen-III oxidase family protein [Dethiothermospora halolimnae]|uniref:coproporphyrinogen-III oxidase family protein n=1 Tax=Dethiothermospora halolimnae TaxID=3114390 RepID=UPI003CCC3329
MQTKKRSKTHHDSMGVMGKLAMGPRNVLEYLDKISDISEKNKKSCIYIHVPFCSKICTFCSLRRNLREPTIDYHKLLIKEIENYSKIDYINNRVFDAVYFGGGTPTTLKKESLKQILKALKKNLNFTDDAEFSIETTITELTDDMIEMFKTEGINRFSVGVQTFSDRGRKILGRKGGGDIAYKKLEKLVEEGFENINIDIIYNYNNQSKEELLEDLYRIYDLDLAGFSLYSLINMGKLKSTEKQDLDIDKILFDTIAYNSEKQGYNFLELTKMTKRDKYKYIINRHNGEDTLPLGAGAGGNFNNLLIMNPIDLDEYKESIYNFAEKKGMLFNPKYNEYIKIKGDIQRGILPTDYSLVKNKEKILSFIDDTIDKGLAVKKDDNIFLTKAGIFWGNNISKNFLNLL